MEVENLDELSPPELDALLERALNPQVPVEVLYAVLERIGPAARDNVRDGVRDEPSVDAPTTVMAAVPAPAPQNVPEPDPEATTVMPPLPPLPPEQLNRGAATDRAVRPERPLPPKQPTAELANGPAQQAPANPAAQVPPPHQNPPSHPNPIPPSRGAHAVTRRPMSPPPESGH